MPQSHSTNYLRMVPLPFLLQLSSSPGTTSPDQHQRCSPSFCKWFSCTEGMSFTEARERSSVDINLLHTLPLFPQWKHFNPLWLIHISFYLALPRLWWAACGTFKGFNPQSSSSTIAWRDGWFPYSSRASYTPTTAARSSSVISSLS